MGELVRSVIDALSALPVELIYLIIGLGAAVENIFPPVPADTFVLLGAFLAAAGRTDPLAVFLITWLLNVASAVFMYGLAHRYGRAIFGTPVGRWLLHPKQLDQIADFYARWGTPAIFFSRFLPGLRAMVPVFAGISHVRARRLIPPLATASALWYGILVYIGTAMGRNWRAILEFVSRVNDILLWIALAAGLAIAVWWWRTRHRKE